MTEFFETTIGTGSVWSDNGIVRVVVKDEYGERAFRLGDADQVAAFIEAVEKVERDAKLLRMDFGRAQ